MKSFKGLAKKPVCDSSRRGCQRSRSTRIVILVEKRQLSTSQKADNTLETSRTHYTSNTTPQHLPTTAMNSSSSSFQKAAGGR
eukprot:scaffold5664_cov94-Skeletonema_dohrnii-CCMP3373.AAC.5